VTRLTGDVFILTDKAAGSEFSSIVND